MVEWTGTKARLDTALGIVSAILDGVDQLRDEDMDENDADLVLMFDAVEGMQAVLNRMLARISEQMDPEEES